MLRLYLRKVRNHCAQTARNLASPHTPRRKWLRSAFRDFVPVGIPRALMLSTLAAETRRAAAALDEWLEGRDGGAALARALLEGCTRADNGRIWHKDLKFRSYVDISIPVKVLRILVGYLASLAEPVMRLDAAEITELLLEHDPSSRPALLVHAELLLERGDAEGAIEVIQRALRVQAVCITAQQLLFRAYEAKRAQGSDAPELAALDYDLTDKFCHLPFTHMSTFFRGTTYACSCPAWVPFPIGNILEAESADAVWNSDAAAEIRRSILDGDFSYCSRTQCSFISARKLPRKSEITTPRLRAYIDGHLTRVAETPQMLELNHDPTCNLACPSCRDEIVSAKAEEVDVYARAAERVILPFLKKVEGHTYITGGGEAFASKHFRSILRALNREEYPALQVFLITNGQLLTPYRWSEFPHLPEMLSMLAVSVDAARAETYERLRRPGKWATLMKNLEWIASMRRAGQIRRFTMNFVVQQDNFREMLEFVALADSLSADGLWFQRVVNYGTYDEATFAAIDVASSAHPDHAELLEILRAPVLKRPSINKQMLLAVVPEYVASDERIEFLY